MEKCTIFAPLALTNRIAKIMNFQKGFPDIAPKAKTIDFTC